MLDENEFLSAFGIRALSRVHRDNPYILFANGGEFTVRYQSGESDSNLFGGNSNWRGPVWFPVNFLIIESLQRFHHYYGDDFTVEHPTGSGNMLTLRQVAEDLSKRMVRLFKKDEKGIRPIYGNDSLLQHDRQFSEYLLFHEYFDGDSGRGLGANHQTGWTGLIAKLIQPIQTRKEKEN